MIAMLTRLTQGLRSRFLPTLLAVLLVLAVGSGPAQAMNWNGENGIVRFSFVEDDPTANIHHAQTEDGVIKLTVWAWLTDVTPVSINGKPFTELGGFELQLKITGARGYILNQKMVEKGLNMSNDKGGFMAGLAFPLPLQDGRTPLAWWEVMFQGEVSDVSFTLDPEGLFSCRTTGDCPENDSQAIYIGSDGAIQLSEMFSAGYEPAWLNPSGDPDVTPVVGKNSWADVGRAQKMVSESEKN